MGARTSGMHTKYIKWKRLSKSLDKAHSSSSPFLEVFTVLLHRDFYLSNVFSCSVVNPLHKISYSLSLVKTVTSWMPDLDESASFSYCFRNRTFPPCCFWVHTKPSADRLHVPLPANSSLISLAISMNHSSLAFLLRYTLISAKINPP